MISVAEYRWDNTLCLFDMNGKLLAKPEGFWVQKERKNVIGYKSRMSLLFDAALKN